MSGVSAAGTGLAGGCELGQLAVWAMCFETWRAGVGGLQFLKIIITL